jgi:cell division septation protein DedD
MSDDGFHEIQLNSKQVIFICMAAALVLVVAFLSGVLVGRGVRSEKDTPAADAVAAAAPVASEVVAGAPATTVTPAAAPPPAVAPPTPVDEDLTYEKRLEGKSAPKETLQPMTPPPAPQAGAREAVKPAKDAKDAAKPTKDAKDAAKPVKEAAAAKTSAPADAARAAKSEGSSFPEPGGSGYYLKIVAYRDRAQAESVAQRLSGKGYRSYIVPAGSLYSVRVGKYKSRREADSIRRRLEKEEQLKPLISH